MTADPIPMSGQDAVLADMQEVIAFLDGSGALDGRYFDDGGDGPRYWWRTPFRVRWAALTRLLVATPASDEAVGDARLLAGALAEVQRLSVRARDLATYAAHADAANAALKLIRDHGPALSARTAAPAEQGVTVEQIKAASVAYYRDATYDVDGHVTNNEGCMRRALEAARLAPIAPDARSVDGLSGDADEALRVLAAWDDFCFSHPGKYPTDEEVRQRELLHSVLCIKAVEFLRTFAPVDRRLAGAKVQGGGE